MKILFISDNFPPETNAPATRLYEHAVRWIRSGCEVTVITGAPNFPEGRVYSGYSNKWYSVEDYEGIKVVRVKTYITSNSGIVRRTLDYLSFMIASFIAGLFQNKYDLVVATSPQFFSAISGWALSVVKKKPFVFELRDLWPESIVAVGAMKKGRAIRVLEALELFLYRRAKRIIVVTEGFKKNLSQRGIPENKIDVILNGADLDIYRPMAPDEDLRTKLELNGKFVVGYIGTHGMAHGLEKVLDTANLLSCRKEIVFIFLGAGAAKEQLVNKAHELGLKNVRFISRQPKELIPYYWSLCDTALIPLRDTPTFKTVIPSKMFECMAMGVPILMAVPDGEATAIIRSSGSGICVAPEDPSLLAESIMLLYENSDLRENIRKCGLEAAPSYTRDRFSERMLTSFNDAIKG